MLESIFFLLCQAITFMGDEDELKQLTEFINEGHMT